MIATVPWSRFARFAAIPISVVPARMRQRAAAALRCRRGTYLIEFTAIAGGLLTMMFGAVEMAWQGVTAIAMENAVLRASRVGSLGCLQADGTRSGQVGPTTLLAEAKDAGAGFLNDSSLKIAATAYSSLAQASARSGGASGAGSGGQTVVYLLTYNSPLLFAGGLIGKPFYTHSGTITIRNEPFASGGAGAASC